MPFRHAHRWLLLLAPVVALAFWPNYFGQLRHVPLALHLHGVVASAWIALLWFQSWTAHSRRLPAHRLAGRTVFVLVPLFAAAGLLIISAMAQLGVDAPDPFHAQFATRLVPEDLVSLSAFLTLAWWAIARRRRVTEHASAMLATAFLLLPAVIGRVIPIATAPLSIRMGQHPFALGFELAQVVTVAACLRLARRHGRTGRPFLFVAIVLATESLLFETVARGASWAAVAAVVASAPALPLVAGGLLLGTAVVAAAWRVGARPRAVVVAATV